MRKVTKRSVLGDILNAHPETAECFLEMGMHCLECPVARSETLELACAAHGVDADRLVEKLNACLAGR